MAIPDQSREYAIAPATELSFFSFPLFGVVAVCNSLSIMMAAMGEEGALFPAKGNRGDLRATPDKAALDSDKQGEKCAVRLPFVLLCFFLPADIVKKKHKGKCLFLVGIVFFLCKVV